jgi:hypothetical protein
MSVVWLIQFVIFLGMAITGLFWPAKVMFFLHDCSTVATLGPDCPAPAEGAPAGEQASCAPRGLYPDPACAAASATPEACETRCTLVESDRETQSLFSLIRLL